MSWIKKKKPYRAKIEAALLKGEIPEAYLKKFKWVKALNVHIRICHYLLNMGNFNITDLMKSILQIWRNLNAAKSKG